MSWDPNYDNSAYGNYGNTYDQQQYGQGHQGVPGGGQGLGRRTPTYGRTTPLQHQGQQQQQQQQGFDYGAGGGVGYSPQQPQQHSFYNPNEYSGGGGANASFLQPSPMGAKHARSPQPTYYSAPPPQPPSSSAPSGGAAGFGIPGFADQMNPMVANMAMQYGQDIVGKGQEEIKRNLDKYVSIGQLKYYFAVDNLYVGKKLGLLLFPFTHSDWSIQYSQEEPVQPKYDLNAPDLYIPFMSYLTYVLVAGYILGLRNSFSPDLLATTASSALVWLLLEIGCVYLSLTLMSVATTLCKWDVLSFSAYKFVGMIAVLMAGLVSQSRQVFYLALMYVSGALAFFIVRTLKLRIEPEVHGMPVHGKRKLYMILLYAGLQPLLIWWMTSYFAPMAAISIPIGTIDVEEA